MAKSYQIEYSDMIDQRGIKIALFQIHEMFASNSFVDLSDIEKIRVLSPTEIEIVTTAGTKHFQYNPIFKEWMP